jgi:hypothetical protein
MSARISFSARDFLRPLYAPRCLALAMPYPPRSVAHQHDVTCPLNTLSPTRRHQATDNLKPSLVGGAVAGARVDVEVAMRLDLEA